MSNDLNDLPEAPAPIDFQVNRDDFRDTRFVAGAPIDSLGDGQVLLKIDRFALTSNSQMP